MKFLRKNKFITMLLLVFSTILLSVVVEAKELNIGEAIKIGIEKNSDLRSLEEEVAQLQRGLAKISAQEDWQLELGADYSYSILDDDANLVDQSGIDLSLSKTFSSGFTLNPGISIIGDDFESDFSVTARQSILSSIPTELQQSYFKQEKNIMKAKANLGQQKANKIMTWIGDYLDLSRMIERKSIYSQAVERAIKNLDQVNKQQAIGEAGKNDLLIAQLSVQEALYSLEDITKQIEEAHLSLVNKLSLDDNLTIKLSDNSTLISNFRERVDELTLDYLEGEDLVKIAKENSYEIYNNLIEKEILEKEFKWLKKSNQPDLDLVGSYDSSDDEFTIGISTSYSLYDSGEHDLELQDKEAEIESKELDYQNIIRGLNEDLKGYINSIDLSKMSLEKARLTIEKNKNELEIAEKQLDMGLIDYLEYQEYFLTAAESEVEYDSLRDQLFIDKFEFINFLNIDDILENF